MSTTILNLIIFLVEEAVKLYPSLAADLKALFASGAPTAADFNALRAKVADESYAKFVPASALPENVVELPLSGVTTPLGTSAVVKTAEISSDAPQPLPAPQLKPGEVLLADGTIHQTAPPVPESN